MKQFRINEQEKSRILGLHVEATSRQYLKEDLNNGMTTIERYNYNRGIFRTTEIYLIKLYTILVGTNEKTY